MELADYQPNLACPAIGQARMSSSASVRQRADRTGFTLIEMLFCIAIIGMLIALLLPAVQAVRETARRHQCANNLSQLNLAIEHYESCHEMLPPGTIDAARPVQSRPVGYHISWIAQILPFIEESNVYRHLDFSAGAYAPKNAQVRRQSLRTLVCPSDTSGRTAGGNYAGCHHDVEAPIDEDNHGVLFLNSRIRYRDIRDGRAQTIVLGELVGKGGTELGWLSGTRATLRNTGTPINQTTAAGGPLALMAPVAEISQTGPGQAIAQEDLPERSPLPDSTANMPWLHTEEFQLETTAEFQPGGAANPALVVGGFESAHGGKGAQFSFGDGSVRFLVDTIDFGVYQRLGHRADGQLLDDR